MAMKLFDASEFYLMWCLWNRKLIMFGLKSEFCSSSLNPKTLQFSHTVSISFFYQLVLAVAMSGHTIQSSSPMSLLPSASSIVNLADSHERAAFANIMKMKEEPMDVESVDSNKEEVGKVG